MPDPFEKSYFRIIEKFEFGPLKSLESVDVCTHRSNPYLLVLKGDRLKIIGLENGMEISTWRLTEANARQIQISTDYVFMGILRSPKLLVKPLIDKGDKDYVSAKSSLHANQGSGKIRFYSWV
jgi:hypothetical protein